MIRDDELIVDLFADGGGHSALVAAQPALERLGVELAAEGQRIEREAAACRTGECNGVECEQPEAHR